MDSSSMLIAENDQVIIKKNSHMRVVQARPDRLIAMERAKFTLNNVIGQPYGSTFEVVNRTLQRVKKTQNTDTDKADNERDNRNLVDQMGNQKLTKAEIEAMKKEGRSGENIVDQLIENSATFQNKTDFSQEKYIKRKQKKYLPVFTILRPTTRLLAEMYYSKGPLKICNLRMDSIGQILCHANVRAHSRVLLVDTCAGLVLGAVMERLAGLGTVVNFYSGSAPTRPALEAYNMSAEYKSILYDFPLNCVNSLHQRHDDKAAESCQNNQADTTDVKNDVKEATESNMEMDTQSPTDSKDTSNGNTSQSGTLQHSPSNGSKEDEEEEDEELLTTETESSDVKAKKTKRITQSSSNRSKEEDEEEEEDEELLTTGKTGTESSDMKAKKRKRITEEERDRRRVCKAKMHQDVRNIMSKGQMDGLIVASKFHPTPIVLALIDYIAPSRQIVVYCQYKEPLLDCYMKLRSKGGVILLKLTETWLREYQVLPDRTHPMVNMSGTGGYILVATTVKTCRRDTMERTAYTSA